ncbi:MAG: hypothetical protein HGA62_07265 [Chlorobiaceae bacterium]|nr:hypothetical protein [Chlorobiaceae bacterium]
MLEFYLQTPKNMTRNPGLLFHATLFQALGFFLDTAPLRAMLQAPGENFSVFRFGLMLSLIPPGPGSFETTCTGLLAMQGNTGRNCTDSHTSLLRVLREFTLRCPMIPGLLLTHRELLQ